MRPGASSLRARGQTEVAAKTLCGRLNVFLDGLREGFVPPDTNTSLWDSKWPN